MDAPPQKTTCDVQTGKCTTTGTEGTTCDVQTGICTKTGPGLRGPSTSTDVPPIEEPLETSSFGLGGEEDTTVGPSLIQGSSENTITIPKGASEGGTHFEDASITVKKGNKINVVNEDTNIHTFTSGSAITGDIGALFDSSMLSSGSSYTLDTVDLEVGTYSYSCILHPSGMGTIKVE